jgi:predicted lipoprotein with Yx(FWY)xxD motif
MQKKKPYGIALMLSLLSAACLGTDDDAAKGSGSSYWDDSPSPQRDAGTSNSSSSASEARDSGVPSARDAQAESVDAADADAGMSGVDVALRSGAAFKNYLSDRQGRPLYFFANDVPGSSASTCTGTCLEKWPAFDAKNASLGEGIAAADVARFMRADGAWQTTFKGRPLYYFATDASMSGVNGDGVGGRWFLARDYTVFFAAKADLVPDAASDATPYLTNRAGRTVYVFKNDSAARAGSPALSACNDTCLDAWPVWKTPSTVTDLVLPSNLKSADFSELQRTIAGAPVQQLTFRGWPLYFHAPDDLPGETSGHLTGAWRAIGAASFAQTATASDAGTASDAAASGDAGSKSDAGASRY